MPKLGNEILWDRAAASVSVKLPRRAECCQGWEPLSLYLVGLHVTDGVVDWEAVN